MFSKMLSNMFYKPVKDDGIPILREFYCFGTVIQLRAYGIMAETANKSIVTSGNYERYSVRQSKRFQHIIDPRTGWPSESRIISATIISNKSIEGDGFSTGVYIMGGDKGIELIESIKGVEAVLITDDRKVYTTSGIRDEFKLTNIEFSYQN